jgi:dTDP-4-dehydrorhamnose reductase
VSATDRADLDLSKPDMIPAILDKIAPSLVVNAAAYTAVDRSEEEPALAHRVNAEAPGAMAQWCASNDIPLIHFSTDYVFNGHGTRPWSEDDTPLALSVYGATKLEGEDRVRAAGGCSLIIRTSWIYAASGTNFLRKIAELATVREELRIVADQIGAPTSAAVIADSLHHMLARGLPAFRQKAVEAHGLVHLASSGEASWYDFAARIVDGLKARGIRLVAERIIPVRTEEYSSRAPRPLNSRFNLGRLRAVFGIAPPHWHDALSPELDKLARDFTEGIH